MGCKSSDPSERLQYMNSANTGYYTGDTKKGHCEDLVGDGSVNDPAAGKCKPPKFFGPDTGDEKSLPEDGQECCCDIQNDVPMPCTEVGEDCDDNGINDAAEMAESPQLDEDGNGVLDACEES